MIRNKVRQALIVGIGDVGEQVVVALNARLEARYGSVPVVQSLVINAPAATPSAAGAVPANVRRLVLDPASVTPERLSGAKAWLPPVTDPAAAARLRGRLALVANIDRVRGELQQMYDALTAVGNQGKLNQRGIAIEERQELDCLLVGTLDDPVASGMLRDLAYLLQNLFVVPQQQAMFVFVNAVAFLPGFSMTTEGGDDTHEAYAVRVQREAEAYAALKELNYAVSGKPYTITYGSSDGQGLVVESETGESPFAQGEVYLVSPVSEVGSTLTAIRDAALMVADWLFVSLSVLLPGALRPATAPAAIEGRVTGYAGIGLASVWAPMDRMADHCAARLTGALVDEAMLAVIPESPEETVARFRAQYRLTAGELKNRLDDSRYWDPATSGYELRPVAFDGIPFYNYRELEKSLIVGHDRCQRNLLPLLLAGLNDNLDTARGQIKALLREQHTRLLDDNPVGGALWAPQVFQQLQQELTAERRALAAELRQQEERLKTVGGEIESTRARYFSAAQVFGRPPFLPALFSLVVLGVVLYSVWRFATETLGEPTLGIVLPAALALWSLIVTLQAAYHVRTARSELVAHYVERLKCYRQKVLLEPLLTLYDSISGWCTDIQERLETLRSHTLEVQALAHQGIDGVKWEEYLLGHPRFELEESALERADLERCYAEVAPHDVRVALQDLMATDGPFSSWQDFAPEEMRGRLWRFARKRCEPLLNHDVREYVGRLTPAKRRILWGRLLGQSAPYLRCDVAHLDPAPPEAERLLGLTDEGTQKDSVISQVRQLDAAVGSFELQDSHRIMSISVRRGLPLFAVVDLRRLKQSYEGRRGAGGLAELHLSRSDMLLPDIFPDGVAPASDRTLNTDLEPRLIFALARWQNLLAKNAKGMYAFSYVAEEDELVFGAAAAAKLPPREAELGRTTEEACQRLFNDARMCGLLTRRVQQCVIGEGRSSQQIAADLMQFLRDPNRAGQLEEWERSELQGLYNALVAKLRKELGGEGERGPTPGPKLASP